MLTEWARVFQLPMWLATALIALLAILAITPEPARDAADAGPAPTSEPTPGPRECVLCGIGETCDPESGQCRFIEATPLPCVKGTKFDTTAEFCLPSGTPAVARPAPAPAPAEPRERETDRRPRWPGSGRTGPIIGGD